MHYKQRDMSYGDAERNRLPSGRTIPLVLGLLVALAQGTVPGGHQEILVEMMSVELEASMQSSVPSELQAAASAVTEEPRTAFLDSPAPTEGMHSGIPDSSAVVGQVFHLRIPSRSANGSCNVHVSTARSWKRANVNKQF